MEIAIVPRYDWRCRTSRCGPHLGHRPRDHGDGDCFAQFAPSIPASLGSYRALVDMNSTMYSHLSQYEFRRSRFQSRNSLRATSKSSELLSLFLVSSIHRCRPPSSLDRVLIIYMIGRTIVIVRLLFGTTCVGIRKIYMRANTLGRMHSIVCFLEKTKHLLSTNAYFTYSIPPPMLPKSQILSRTCQGKLHRTLSRMRFSLVAGPR